MSAEAKVMALIDAIRQRDAYVTAAMLWVPSPQSALTSGVAVWGQIGSSAEGGPGGRQAPDVCPLHITPRHENPL